MGSDRQKSEPFVSDIDRGVDVTVVFGSTVRAYPIPDGQIFDLRVDTPAYGTGLRGWKERIGEHDSPSVSLSLVQDHIHKFAPARI